MTTQRRRQTKPDLRQGSAPYERVANSYQRSLLSSYNAWARNLSRELQQASDRGVPRGVLPSIVHNRIPILQAQLEELGRKHIQAGIRVGVGRQAVRTSPRLQSLAQRQIQTNANLLSTSLLLDIDSGMSEALTTTTRTIDRQFLNLSLDPFRSRVASYSGGAWVAIFESQREYALDIHDTRRVRWSLHPDAQHCVESPEHYGCPDLEGEYDGWSDLPTVPAGLVTCRGNCRCHLEVETSPGTWQRGLSE